jgi:hypothetical protein
MDYGEDAAAHPTYAESTEADPTYAARGVVEHVAAAASLNVAAGGPTMEGQ